MKLRLALFSVELTVHRPEPRSAPGWWRRFFNRVEARPLRRAEAIALPLGRDLGRPALPRASLRHAHGRETASRGLLA